MRITISGKPGSGKSTVAKALAKKLGLEHHSAGDLFRQIAQKRGLSPLELNERIRWDPSIDQEIDSATLALEKSKKNLILDARLGFFFLPGSFKVFLDISPLVAGQRVFNQMRKSEQENSSQSQTTANLKTRLRNEIHDYKARYGVDYTDPHHFDLVIDTSNQSVESIVRRIERALGEKTPRQMHIKEKRPKKKLTEKRRKTHG